jgi:hypothetical protein
MKEDSNEKKLGLEEEKKDGSPRRVTPTNLEVLQESLPEEIQGKVYEDEGDLWEDLEKLDLTDLHIVLDNEGYAVWREMPGPIHNAGVSAILNELRKWEREQGAVVFGRPEASVFVSESYQRNKKRCPDFAIWGPDRLNERGSVRGNLDLGKVMNPHVIFQFSWGNIIEQEKKAIDDMSMFAGQGDLVSLELPKVLYLIKATREGDPNPQSDSHVHGFDVYVVRQGERTGDPDPALTYRIGGNEDVTIEVAPGDMGLPQEANPFLLSLSVIRDEMEDIGVVFEAENA